MKIRVSFTFEVEPDEVDDGEMTEEAIVAKAKEAMQKKQ